MGSRPFSTCDFIRVLLWTTSSFTDTSAWYLYQQVLPPLKSTRDPLGLSTDASVQQSLLDSWPQEHDDCIASEHSDVQITPEGPEVDSIFLQLDSERRFRDYIHKFYDCLTQRTEPIITHPVNMTTHVRQCPPYFQQILDNCRHKSLSKTAVSTLYHKISCYERSLSE